MAARLEQGIGSVPRLTITHPVQTNAVFARLPSDACAALRKRFAFYVWDENSMEVRWMCSWDTTEEDVDAFADAVRESLA
jgi:threonine aldolase